MSEGTLAALVLAGTVALHAGFAAAVGAVMSAAWLRRGASPWARRGTASSLNALRGALLLTALASLGTLWLRAAEMAEAPLALALPAVRSVLSETHYGRAWLVGAAALLVALAAAWRLSAAATTSTRGVFVMLALTGFAWARSVTGHAAVQGDFAWPVAVDVAHRLSMGLWAGTVFVGAFVLSAACDTADRGDRARWVRTLSSSATLALGVVAATGTVNAWHGLGSPGDLAATAYGNALLAKLGLVGVAVGLGGVNRFVWMPRLLEALQSRQAPVERRLRRFLGVLRIESTVLLAAVVAAAVLGTTQPANGG